MAIPMTGKTKNHRERKNPGMRDKFTALRRETNAKRPKQHWVGGTTQEGGHWERE